MIKRIIQHTIIGVVITYLVMTLIHSIYLWDTVQNYYQLIARSLLYPLYWMIPTSVGIFVGIKNLQGERSKKILYKMPLAAISTILIILGIMRIPSLLIPCSGEWCGLVIFLLITIPAVGVFLPFFFLVTLFIYFFYQTRKLKLILLSIFTILILTNIGIIIANKGCTGRENECWYNKAIKSNDISVCEEASNPTSCFISAAYHTKDLSICNNILTSPAAKKSAGTDTDFLERRYQFCKEGKL